MDDLEERLTINFPVPITSSEVEDNLFVFLRNGLGYHIDYEMVTQGRKDKDERNDEKYVSKIIGRIRTLDSFPSFEMMKTHLEDPYAVFFNGIKFQALGVDDIRELESLPSGKGELIVMDEVRKKTEEYFSERPK